MQALSNQPEAVVGVHLTPPLLLGALGKLGPGQLLDVVLKFAGTLGHLDPRRFGDDEGGELVGIGAFLRH
jgi:hypothetical protein